MALGNWLAAADLNVLAPVADGKTPEKALYFETRFTLPAEWPAERLWLASPGIGLGKLYINNYPVEAAGLTELDISGLVKRDGENVLRLGAGRPQDARRSLVSRPWPFRA